MSRFTLDFVLRVQAPESAFTITSSPITSFYLLTLLFFIRLLPEQVPTYFAHLMLSIVCGYQCNT